MTGTVDAVRIGCPGNLAVGREPEPTAQVGQVLVRSAHVGICGSDVSLLKGTRPAAFTRYPVVPGHEWSGVVHDTGPGVDGVAIGDAVAVQSLWWCGRCDRCRDGRTQLCERGYHELGFTEPGGLAALVAVDARQIVPLPAGVALPDAALIEPAAVVAHAFARAPDVAGRQVTVVGDGTLGLIAVQLARLHGAAGVTLIGRDELRRELGRRLGAHDTMSDTDAARRSVRTADVVIECAGAPGTLALALDTARDGGSVCVVGVVGGDARLDIAADVFVTREVSVIGVLAADPASWAAVLRLVGHGLLDLGSLVTHEFPLAEAADAFARAADPVPGQVKILITHDTREASR